MPELVLRISGQQKQKQQEPTKIQWQYNVALVYNVLKNKLKTILSKKRKNGKFYNVVSFSKHLYGS